MLFPRNSNVVATLSLAGLGLGNVSVILVADPDANMSRHVHTATAGSCQAAFTFESAAAAGNWHCSHTTVYSLLHETCAFAEQSGAVPA